MNIEDMIANIEDLGLESIETKADMQAILKPNPRFNKTRKQNKKDIIEYGESLGIDCSIFKQKITRKEEDEYLNLLSQGLNIGLFATEELTAPIIRRVAYMLFATDLFQIEDFENSTPFGTCLIVFYAIGNLDKFLTFPKQYVMNLKFSCTVDLIGDNALLLKDYMEIFDKSKYKDCLYHALLDVLETLKGTELEKFKSNLLNSNLSLEKKEELVYSKLEATNDGLKHLMELVKYATDTTEGNKLNDVDKFNSCIREDVLDERLTEAMIDYSVWCDENGIISLPNEKEMDEILNNIRSVLDNLN